MHFKEEGALFIYLGCNILYTECDVNIQTRGSL